jgi:hypothetical protein
VKLIAIILFLTLEIGGGLAVVSAIFAGHESHNNANKGITIQKKTSCDFN